MFADQPLPASDQAAPANPDTGDDQHLFNRVRLLRNLGLTAREVVAELPNVPAKRVRYIYNKVEELHPRVERRSPDVIECSATSASAKPSPVNPTDHGATERARRTAMKARVAAILAPVNRQLKQRRRDRAAAAAGVVITPSTTWIEQIAHRCEPLNAEARRAANDHAEARARELAQLGGEPDDAD